MDTVTGDGVLTVVETMSFTDTLLAEADNSTNLVEVDDSTNYAELS